MQLRLLASFFVILSGLVLVLDKFFVFYNIELSNNFGFTNSRNLIFFLSQGFSTILLIFASNLKPYRLFYVVPFYIVIIQYFWVFTSEADGDESFFNIYAIGSSILFIICLFFLDKILKRENKKKILNKKKISILEAILDLSTKQTSS